MLEHAEPRAVTQAAPRAEVDIRVVGHPLAPIGMGEHARSVYRAMRASHQSAQLVDIYGPFGVPDAQLVSELSGAFTPALGTGVNLFCINGDEVAPVLSALSGRGAGRGYNIIYPAWELERYPEEWARQLERFDEIWAPSAFIYEGIRRVVSKPVIHMPLACEVRGAALRSRRHFGIPDSAYAFLFFFDFLSYVERKNPFAVVAAFKRLLEKTPFADVALVVKTNNSERHPEAYARFMREIASLRGQTIIIDKTLSDPDTKSLVKLCDCFVSLHRSEGFGRGLSEAMYLSKPVIATAYSGNMDFCNTDTVLLVDFDLIPVVAGEYPHWEDQVWADPDVDQAVDYMMRLVQDQAWGRAVGRRGREEIFRNFSFRSCGLRYLSRIQSIAGEKRVF